MNTLSPKKLLHSKWTAVIPANKEKHFIVTAVVAAYDPAQPPESIDLQAVHSGATRRLGWRELRDEALWRQGWT